MGVLLCEAQETHTRRQYNDLISLIIPLSYILFFMVTFIFLFFFHIHIFIIYLLPIFSFLFISLSCVFIFTCMSCMCFQSLSFLHQSHSKSIILCYWWCKCSHPDFQTHPFFSLSLCCYLYYGCRQCCGVRRVSI